MRPVPMQSVNVRCGCAACTSASGLADRHQGWVLLMQLNGMHAAQHASAVGAKGSRGQHSPPRHHQAKLAGRLACALIWGKRTWGDDRLLFLLHALPLLGLHRGALCLRCCGVSRVHVLVFRLRLQHQHCTPLPSVSGHASAQAMHIDPAGLESLPQVRLPRLRHRLPQSLGSQAVRRPCQLQCELAACLCVPAAQARAQALTWVG